LAVQNWAGNTNLLQADPSTKKIGLFGATPVVQATTFSAVTTTTPALASYGFTQAQAEALIANVNLLREAVRGIGIVA
jgi:ribosome-binding ATPase YchF (GTP1/OBG family)